MYGTDVNGTITVTTDGTAYEITTEKEGQVEKGSSTVNQKNDTEKPKAHGKTATSGSDCIDINEASQEELMEITQIGEARAEQIIDLRPFNSVDELTKIKGIGSKRIDEIKAQGKACVGGG